MASNLLAPESLDRSSLLTDQPWGATSSDMLLADAAQSVLCWTDRHHVQTLLGMG